MQAFCLLAILAAAVYQMPIYLLGAVYFLIHYAKL